MFKTVPKRYWKIALTLQSLGNELECIEIPLIGMQISGGRPSIVTKSTRQYIKRLVLTGYLKTAKDVQMKLEDLGHPMSYQSAINVLHSVEIYAEIKKKKPLLTEKHKRLDWHGPKSINT
jgi:hypothetical protein